MRLVTRTYVGHGLVPAIVRVEVLVIVELLAEHAGGKAEAATDEGKDGWRKQHDSVQLEQLRTRVGL